MKNGMEIEREKERKMKFVDKESWEECWHVSSSSRPLRNEFIVNLNGVEGGGPDWFGVHEAT